MLQGLKSMKPLQVETFLEVSRVLEDVDSGLVLLSTVLIVRQPIRTDA